MVVITYFIIVFSTEDVEAASVLLPGGTTGITLDNVLIAKYVCKLVLIRAALLTAICKLITLKLLLIINSSRFKMNVS